MELDYNEVFEIKKIKKKPKVLLIFVSLLIIITISYFIWLILQRTAKYDVLYPSTTYYAVVLQQSEDVNKLTELYQNAVSIGASGYIWKGKDINYLIALIYPTEDMAKSVIASNQVDNYNLEIVQFSTPKVAYNLENHTQEEINIIKTATQLMYDLGKVMYELTISVQIGNLSSIAGASTINNYKGDILVFISEIEKILTTKTTNEVSDLLQKLIKISNILEKLVNDLIVNSQSTNAIKYSYCEYIYELCNN